MTKEINPIKTYYNEISIYLDKSNPPLKGEVYIDENNYCEGIMYDNDNNSYFIFGTFKKYDYLDLYTIKNEKINRYCARKKTLRYEGETYLIINNSVISKDDFYMTVSELEVDPRDVWINPKDEFIDKLNISKEHIYTIGDGYSDIEMIKDYNGFCMKNSVDEVLKLGAKYYENVSELVEDVLNEKI